MTRQLLDNEEKRFGLWLKKQVLLSDQLARLQNHVAVLQDAVDQLTRKYVDLREAVDKPKGSAEILREDKDREGQRDVRAD